MERQQHWDKVYSDKGEGGVSWFQSHPEVSLKLVQDSGISQQTPIIDIGAGASRLVDHLLQAGYSRLTVLDLSAAALEVSRQRLGSRAEQVSWLCADISREEVTGHFGLWHDRAVFHFLTDANERRHYRDTVTRLVPAGGHVIVATFALDGPEKCSGLPVVRYGPETLSRELGNAFDLQGTIYETHMTPSGNAQKFIYCRFLRR